ncbi:MAG: DUF1318 domain-containing protein [Endomicrobia bacterium]|nr:DUF1318 domain-containing protein [Endomicrobiia bacterium]
MNCKKYEKLLILYLDDVISEKDRKKIEVHLQGCPSCRKTFEEFKRIKDILTELPVKQVHKEVITKVQKRIEEITQESYFKSVIEQLKSVFRFASIRILAPAMVSLVLIVGVMMFLKERVLVRKQTIKEERSEVEHFLPETPKVAKTPQSSFQNTLETIRDEEATETGPAETVKVAEIKVDLPEEDIAQPEQTLLAFVATQESEDGRLRSIERKRIALRGQIPPQEQKLVDEFSAKLTALNLSFLELTPELKEIYIRRYKRMPVLKQLKTNGYIGENNKAQLTILDEKKLTDEHRKLVEEENADRQKMIEMFVNQYMKKRKISGIYKNTVIKKATEIMTKILHSMAGPGELIQTSEGKWLKKM